MTSKDLKQIFPSWYKEWLFGSLGIRDGQEISEKYLTPISQLNKNWLAEHPEQEVYRSKSRNVAISYALYYMTINIPKLWMILNNSGIWRNRELHDIDTIVEFGCGPGTFLWSYLFYLQETAPKQLQKLKKIRGIDISPAYINVAQRLFRTLRTNSAYAHIEAEFICGKWEDHVDDSISQLGIFGNSLIESSTDLGSIPMGYSNLLIIEPGTRQHFQKLRLVRDTLFSQHWHIHFPCSGGSKCPMDEYNWCHFYINRFLLPFVQKMSSAANRRNHRHNFSAFLFSRQENQLNESCWRILSPTRKIRRAAIRYICNGNQMFEATLGRRARNESNKAFIDMQAGSMGVSTSRFQKSRFSDTDSFKSFSP